MNIFSQQPWDSYPQIPGVSYPLNIYIHSVRNPPLHIQRIKKLVEALQALHKIKYRG